MKPVLIAALSVILIVASLVWVAVFSTPAVRAAAECGVAGPIGDHPPKPEVFNENKMQPQAVRVGRAIAARWPQIQTIGGWRPTPSGAQDHGVGQALDVMIPDSTRHVGKDLGDEIAEWAMANVETARIVYIGWRGRIWNYAGRSDSDNEPIRPSEWRIDDRDGYRPQPVGSPFWTRAHMDHLHIAVNGPIPLGGQSSGTAEDDWEARGFNKTGVGGGQQGLIQQIGSWGIGGPPESVGGLDDRQMANAATIIRVGSQMNIPERGIIVALATASQESRFLNFANDGSHPGLRADQRGVSRSLELPHEAVGRDHGSVGIFQQQFPWWGTLEELMDPATSAKKFYEALNKVNGWEQMPVTVAAQRVQQSAFPNAYADDEQLARQLIAAIDPSQYGGAELNCGAAPEAMSCAPTNDVLEKGLQPDGVRVVRCSVQEFVELTDPATMPNQLLIPITGSDRQQLAKWTQKRRSELGVGTVTFTDKGMLLKIARSDEQIASATKIATRAVQEHSVQGRMTFNASRFNADKREWKPLPPQVTVNKASPVEFTMIMPDGPRREQTAAKVAQWLTVKSKELGVRSVQHRDRKWSDGKWQQAKTSTAAPRIKVTVWGDSAGIDLTDGRWAVPVGKSDAVVGSGYGPRSGCDICSSFHQGIDLGGGHGNPIYAAAGGKVISNGWAGGFGNLVVVEAKIGSQTYSFYYAHQPSASKYISVGDRVRSGQRIGSIGTTGNSTGPHLHFEIRIDGQPRDPIPILKKHGVNL